ncbi:uncharacterized protein LOC123515896 [Portunus trituberculatus]|uniref:uncharacterized protein LOC123515896 n=1 Tax=Portunus trituberculatus TaxID=210409 RepID=UPI001E1CF8D8|nr:uncharacterized protein LOC123515896 [Portunus trituberculatus]
MAASLDVARLLQRAWVVAVVMVASVIAVDAEGVPEARSILPLQAVGRAGASLYHSTMHYLMDQLAPDPDPARSGTYNPDVACMGAMYRRGGGGSVCVDAVTAAVVVGAALALQFAFYVAVSTACPLGYSLSASAYRNGNITYVITVDNSNTIGVEVAAGDQDLDQTQMQDQSLTQSQTQTASAQQTAPQSITLDQDQDQTQGQTQSQSGSRSMNDLLGPRAEAPHLRRWRRWTLPPMGFIPLDLSTLNWPDFNLDWSGISISLCPLLGRYIWA